MLIGFLAHSLSIYLSSGDVLGYILSTFSSGKMTMISLLSLIAPHQPNASHIWITTLHRLLREGKQGWLEIGGGEVL